MNATRREFLGVLGAGVLGATAPRFVAAAKGARVVVIGGGFGGATAARFVKRLLPNTQVTLIEQSRNYVACPFSNLVVVNQRTVRQQTFAYSALAGEGVKVVRARATRIDGTSRQVMLEDGSQVPYDRLIASPGIDFRWGALPGYDKAMQDVMPHAWQAGAQTELLRDALLAMPDGGVFAIAVPAAPFRCPPGPYERASLVADYLKREKPRSKLIVLDSNHRFSKQSLFLDVWQRRYGDLVEWRGPDDDGVVRRVEAGRLHTDFDVLHADVANVIPPQQAGRVATVSGLADSTGWCPINAMSFESALIPNVHVIGDAAIAAPMPKSAFAANAQAKVCAYQVARLLAGQEAAPTTLVNTCYSFVDASHAVSVSGVYHNLGGEFASVPGAGGESPLVGGNRQMEAKEARDWFTAITSEVFM